MTDTKQDVYSLGDGRFITVSWSAPLSLQDEEMADVLNWFDLLKRKIARMEPPE